MTAKKLHLLIIALSAFTAGSAIAGTGDITRRDAEGSVELSNLGEQDAAVVVAVPAKSAPVVPAANSANAAKLLRPALPHTTTLKDKPVKDATDEAVASDASDRSNEEESDIAKRGDSEVATDGATPAAATPDWAVQQPFATGVLSGAGTPATPESGAGTTADAPAASTTEMPDTSGIAGAPIQDGGTSGVSSGGQNSAVLDSPELLAQRLAQYRDQMVNAQLGTNGLSQNPAVRRRYLMINRSGYMNGSR